MEAEDFEAIEAETAGAIAETAGGTEAETTEEVPVLMTTEIAALEAVVATEGVWAITVTGEGAGVIDAAIDGVIVEGEMAGDAGDAIAGSERTLQ